MRRARIRRLGCLVVIFFVLATTAAACGGDDDEAPPSNASGDIDEITWALPSFPDVLFVPHDWTTYTGAIMSLVQEGPLAFGDDLSLIEGVADSWEQTNPTTYVYHLRQGVTFHDGSPLTAEDVAFSMNWHSQPDSGSQLAAFFASVKSIEATADDEVTVQLKKPDVQFQYSVAHMSGFIFKKDQLEADPENYGTPDVLPVGTGPFKITEFVPDERIVLERFDDYWGPKSPVKRIVFSQIPDQQTRLLAMQNGDIDGTFDLPIAELEQWSNIEGVDVITAPSNGVYLLTMDQEAPPFNDIHVRRAITHAIDKPALAEGVLKGYGQPAAAINPPGMWTGVLEEAAVQEFYDSLPQLGFDLEAAEEELAQSSVPDGFEFSVQAPNTDRNMVNSLLVLSENLKQIGVTLNVQEVDYGQWLDTYFAHEDLGMQMMAYFPDYADPANYPYLFLYSGNAVKDGLNASNYRNEEVDANIEEALSSPDATARAEALKEVIAASVEDAAIIPLFWPDSAMAIRSDLRLDGYNAFWYNIPWAIRGFGTK